MKSINFKQCLKVLKLQRSRGSSNKLCIGILSDHAPYHLSHYGKEPLLFSRSVYDHDTVTIEKPMSNAELKRQKLNNSFLTTTCTMVGVPESLIVEIKI